MAGFDVAGARKAGYSDAEIAEELATDAKFDVAGARKAGYSDTDIVKHLTGEDKDRSVMGALRQGVADVVGGVGRTGKYYGPEAVQGASEGAMAAGDKIADPAYERAAVYDKDGLHLENAPRALVEQAPGMGLGIAAARATPGPWWAKLGSGAGAYVLQSLGTRAKERAEAETGDPNAEPTTGQKVKSAVGTILEAAVGAFGNARFLSAPAAKSLREAGKRLATTAGVETGVGGAQEAIGETSRTVGTDAAFEPERVINSALTQGATGAGLAAPRAARDASSVSKYREFRGANEEASNLVASRLEAKAQGDLASPKVGEQAMRDAETEIKGELRTALKSVDVSALSPEAQGAIKRAQLGRNLTETDHSQLKDLDPAIQSLARQSSVLAMVGGLGTRANGSFKGGIAAPLERGVRAIQNPVGAGVATGLGATFGGANLGAMFTAGLPAMGALAGGYGAARAIDSFTGNRSPANRFRQNFTDRGGNPSPTVTPPPAPPAPPGPQAPLMGDLVAALNARRGPGFGLDKPPAGFKKEVNGAVKIINREQRESDKRFINDAGALLEQLSRQSKRQPWDFPTGELIERGPDRTMYQGAPAPQAALPPSDGVIRAGAPEPQRMLPPPAAMYTEPPAPRLALPAPPPKAWSTPSVSPTKAPPIPWTKENIDRLQKRLAEGASMREIAEEFGTTRNAIIGKADRLRKQAIKWDRKTTGEGGRPLSEDQVVIEVDPKALDAAFKRTSPEMYDLIEGRKGRLKEHIEADKPVSLPEVGAVNGRVGFTNGRTRARLAAELGEKKIPIAVERDNVDAVRKALEGNAQFAEVLNSVAEPSVTDTPAGLAQMLATPERLDYKSAGAVRKNKPTPGFVPPEGTPEYAAWRADIDRAMSKRDREAKAWGEAVAPKTPKTIVPAPKEALKAPADDDDGIPAFLRRTKEAPKAPEAPKDDGPAMSRHFVKGDIKATIEKAVKQYSDENPGAHWLPKSIETINRVISKKGDIGDAIAKEVPGFDKDGFVGRLVETRSYAGGDILKEFMKRMYPKYAEVFDKHMSGDNYAAIYNKKTSQADGTRKPKKK